MDGYVLVTGTSRGIGKAVVNELKSGGCGVICITRSDKLKVEVEEGQIKVGFDWIDFEGMASAIIQAIGKNSISGVINNAGQLKKNRIADESYKAFSEHMRVNVWNQLAMFRALYNVSLLNEECSILNIGSMGGVQGTVKFPGLFSYSASKAAFAALTESLDTEYGGQGLSFNYLALGAVNTEMLQEAFPGYISEVNPENMAKFIVSILSSSGRIMSGKIIQVAKSDPEA